MKRLPKEAEPLIYPKAKLFLSSSDTEGVFGGGKYRLLSLIKTEGNLVKATEIMKISYRKAWGELRRAEDALGKELVTRSRGGASRGHTRLTKYGEALLTAWESYTRDVKKKMEKSFERYLKGILK
ncbi:MAG: LysR family transcriptional regulator [Fibrobacteria bacterium]|nr:LysR family transcriptional regulator [Fibrobacteria bacterium]